MNFRKNPSKLSAWTPGLLIFGGCLLLEVFSLLRYNLHIPQLVEKGFNHDLFHKGWLLKDYFSNHSKIETQVAIDTIKIDMQPNRYAEMSAEWNKQFRNNHDLDNSPWTEKKEKYACRVKHVNSESSKWMKSKISMTGMWSDHHGGFDYFSMKLKLNGDNRMFGEKAINLLVPGTRNYIIDPVANQLYKELFQGIQIRYTPVVVKFRKQKPMYLLREDDISKYLIERNQRRESVIFEKGFAGPLKHLPGLEEQNIDLEFNVELDDSAKTAKIGQYVSELFNKKHDELFPKIDKEKFLGIFSIGVVMKSWHHMVDINLHWYFNPVNNTFEPLLREIAPDDRLTAHFNPGNNTYAQRVQHYKYHIQFFNETISHNRHNFVGQYLKWLEKNDPSIFEKIDKNVQLVSSRLHKKLQDPQLTLPFEGMTENQIIDQKQIISVLQKRADLFVNLKHSTPTTATEVMPQTSTEIWSGTKIIRGIVTIPRNKKLIIQSGTTIKFTGSNSILYVWGDLDSKGTVTAPVKFIADIKTRASLFFETPNECRLTYTNFDGFSNLSNQIHGTPAALTIHRSKLVRIDHCEFANNRVGDDILNIFDCKDFVIENSHFHHVLSDAFDSDFSNGIVRNNRFVEIGNDGVDGSGSIMQIHDNSFTQVHDKAISCGERSTFDAFKNSIQHSAIAFVSKDQSKLNIYQNHLGQNDLQIAVFQKKPEYGQAQFTADFDINKTHYLIQKKSKVRHKGNKIALVKDVESMLYGKQFGRATKKG